MIDYALPLKNSRSHTSSKAENSFDSLSASSLSNPSPSQWITVAATYRWDPFEGGIMELASGWRRKVAPRMSTMAKIERSCILVYDSNCLQLPATTLRNVTAWRVFNAQIPSSRVKLNQNVQVLNSFRLFLRSGLEVRADEPTHLSA